MTERTARIVEVLKKIPKGRVSSYGRIAERAGIPGAARQVVRLLHSLSEKEGLPWHRVLRSDGSIALAEGGGFELQKALLESEGVRVSPQGKVDLDLFLWRG
jgi:methylated-DNA-protein-cysteine methyltransferase-like protein